MDRYAFLTKLLPSPDHGTYIATISAPNPRVPGENIMYNRGFADIESLANFCHGASAKGYTAYYALGTFEGNREDLEDGRVKWRRKASMATAFKTFAVDIDCGADKPYQDQRAGIHALAEFLKKSGLPKPLVVSSGYGLHCYWPLTATIDVATWRVAADHLKALAEQHEFHIDRSKVSDPAMVLRPIDTNNWKGAAPVPVRVVADVAPFDSNALISKFMQGKAAPKPLKVDEKSALFAAMDAAYDNQPADPERIVQHCAQLRRITFHHGANASEPEWYAAIGIAAFCDNPETTAVEWSKGHADYDEGRTLQKLQQWKSGATGPTTCVQFDRTCPGTCGGCKLQGKIGSPIRLGAPEAKPIEIATTNDPLVPQPFSDPPAPFRRTEAGITVTIDGVPLTICGYDIFPSHIIKDPALGYDETIWYWNKPFKGYTKLRIRLSHIFNDSITDLNNDLADNGVLIETKQKQVYMGAYMRAYIQKLQREQASTELYTSFGWKNNYQSFVIGSTEFTRLPDGSVKTREVGVSKTITDKQLDVAFESAGNPDLWTTWTKALSAQGMEGHCFALGVGFAAPLVALTALNGFCVSLLGDGGEGKSVIQTWINSIYGNPRRLGMKKDDTQLAITQRMGMLANLPVTVDECTFMEEKQLGNLVYWSTQGQDRNRATESVASNWAMPVVMSTNKSLRDKLIATAADSDAMSMRMLEFTFHKNKVFDGVHDYGRRIAQMLQENYGFVGRKYISYLMSLGVDRLKQLIDETMEEVKARYNATFEGKERYWVLAICLTDLGNRLAAEAGLIKYNPIAGTDWAMSQLDAQRAMVREAASTPYDMLAMYINQHIGSSLTVVTRHNGSTLAADPIPRNEVFVRKEIYTNASGQAEKGYLFVDRRHFHQWLISNGFDYKKMYDEFRDARVEYKPNAYGKVTMGKGTPLRLGQVPVLGLHLNHPALKHMLDVPSEMEAEADNVVALRR